MSDFGMRRHFQSTYDELAAARADADRLANAARDIDALPMPLTRGLENMRRYALRAALAAHDALIAQETT